MAAPNLRRNRDDVGRTPLDSCDLVGDHLHA
jgi:hypothetical protein